MTQVWFPQKNLARTVKSAGQSLLREGAALGSTLANNRLIYRWGPWSGGAFLVTMLWATEWRLILATALGIGSMRLVYWLLTHRQQLQSQPWRKTLASPQGQLLLAGGSGGLSALGTYIATMVWSAVDNPWLATGIILQGLGSVATVGLLLWQREKSSAPKLLTATVSDFDHCLHSLAHGDRLQKLIALRQLQQCQENQWLTSAEQRELQFYLLAFLEINGDHQLQRGALTMLNVLNDQHPPPKPLSIPQPQRERQAIR